MTEFSALTKSNIDANPIRQFQAWLDEVRGSGVSEQDAISRTLATAGKDGQPSSRIGLPKTFDDRGFASYTNSHSRKAKQRAGTPPPALPFSTPPLSRTTP